MPSLAISCTVFLPHAPLLPLPPDDQGTGAGASSAGASVLTGGDSRQVSCQAARRRAGGGAVRPVRDFPPADASGDFDGIKLIF